MRDAVCQTVLAAAVRPVALFIDDLQWVDGPSLAALRLLSRLVREIPVLVVATARDLDATAHPDLRRHRNTPGSHRAGHLAVRPQP